MALAVAMVGGATEPARAIIVEARQSCRIVVETGWMEVRDFCLELLCNLSGVVQTEEEDSQADGFLSVRADRVGQVITHPAMLRV